MRRSKHKYAFAAGLALALALIASAVGQAIVLPEANPPARHEGWVLSERSEPILERACFDCHSNATRWPWYSYVPPVSLNIAFDVAEGREHLNFSEWNQKPLEKQAKAMQHMLEEIRTEEMPLPKYLFMHDEARLSEADIALLTEDVAARYGVAYTEPPAEDELHEDHE